MFSAYIASHNEPSKRLIGKYRRADGSLLVPCVGTDIDGGHVHEFYDINASNVHQLIPELVKDAVRKASRFAA